MLKRRATAVWTGTGLEGHGTLQTPSGALDGLAYSVHTRFADEHGTAGTNPEELLAAAHAGCFNMALSFQLTGAGFSPEELRTRAVLSLEQRGVHWRIVGVALELVARVPGVPEPRFRELVEAARTGCPVSRALAVDVSLDARLA